ncbi:ATP-binding protein/SpoIIE family protein phosphatase [Streptomyces sp. OfavH-34-F]|uniref:ATP-binding SpoIIE family protein phosphatase n=1 Tax=Streptomyces sp. OfavH-34-F TaxID=2917760 RepID=UPI001EF1AF58|nr:ATP-binding SpoIIE family protein phosphatase [Streptomyces sp. OfavH-34-F]MCG7523923.1 ATP-binding protein/SpoIIE family protein phosphatase [Streptomyces sp. OfavH-34-F]
MGALNLPVLDAEDVVWLRDQEALPAAARVAAAALARRIGFDEQRQAEVALAVSEAATNLRRHAVEGSLLLRAVRTPSDAGLECVTVDEGPGMADVVHSLSDGTSSAGTLGIGLGTISRLADSFDLHSLPGRGTVLAARFWQKEAAVRMAALGRPAVEGLTRSITGEEVCGDAWAARPTSGGPLPDRGPAPQGAPRPSRDERFDWARLTGYRQPGTGPGSDGGTAAPQTRDAGNGQALLMLLCDGLGHGPLAARAAQTAVHAFRDTGAEQPETIMRDIHHALRGGRGGAVAVVRVEPEAGTLAFCGVGNVSTFVVDPATGTRRSLPSAPGIVGHQLPTLRTVRQPLPPHSAVIMHSDGLTERWRAETMPGFLERSPLVAAAQLLREAGVRRDDAGVVVAKGPW